MGQLKTCYDPEPVNIVDHGLVYALDIKSTRQAAATSPSNDPHRAWLRDGSDHSSEARQKILSIDGVTDANVDLVYGSSLDSRPNQRGRQTKAGNMILGSHQKFFMAAGQSVILKP
jgi:hypothetical protein